MLQEESSRKIQGLEENIKVLQKESSKENQGLKENISEIMTILKNEWKSSSVLSEIIEQSNDSGTNNRTISDGIISTSNLYISSEAMSSPINSSIIDASHSVVKMLQEESSRKIQGLEENIKVLQKESSKEIQGLKENISEIMTFLKNEWKSPSVFSEIIEQSNDSGTNNR